jgi:uncharacterized membrane protein
VLDNAMTSRSETRIEHQTVAKNIEAILRLEEDDERRLPRLHRISHSVGAFVGTTYFVIGQAFCVVLWLLWNVAASPSFDPYPFPLLSAVLALEAVFLTSFVLIRQNSTDRQSERRNHLDLQINLLAEKEATSILKALHEMAAHFDIRLTTRAENLELSQDTPVESIARNLRSKENGSSQSD